MLEARSSATGRPSRVMQIASPCSTRSTTSPPWFRSSLIETLSIRSTVSPVIQRDPQRCPRWPRLVVIRARCRAGKRWARSRRIQGPGSARRARGR